MVQVQEQKGLDMVRRDWCPLSKDVGNFALREILSAKPKEEVVAAIHDHLHKVRLAYYWQQTLACIRTEVRTTIAWIIAIACCDKVQDGLKTCHD